jgi:hypothetical protein
MPIPTHVRLEQPWQALPVDQVAVLTRQLQSELAPGHVLFGLKARAIAMRANQDDVLFELSDHTSPLAVVHLTWNQEAQSDPSVPATQLFANWDDWVRERLIPDSSEFRE